MSDISKITNYTFALERKNIKVRGNNIFSLYNATIDIKTWGKIDYLVNHCGYTH